MMNSQLHNQESMLRESIKHFLTSYHNGNSDFSSFESIFFRLIQTMLDPPLEIAWFYSAVTFHAAKSGPLLTNSNTHPCARVLVAKDLLNLLTSCSNLSSTSKKIALLAPVVYELYNIVHDCRKNSLCVDMEVEKLVDQMISYAVVAAGLYGRGNGVAESDSVVVCFEDLVRVWTADRGGRNSCIEENLRVFFPILSDGVWKGKKGRLGVQELVGMVFCEVFFLKLYLSVGSGMCTEDLLTDTGVQTIKGFRNFHFLDILFGMLLEPSLPIAALLRPEKKKVILQTALYDAVMMQNLSYSESRVQSGDPHAKQLALQWVFVADKAIQFARDTNDQARADSYREAFVGSCSVTELTEWACTQAGVVEYIVRPDISTPKAFISWLLVLENQGLQVFDEAASTLRLKALALLSIEEDIQESMSLELQLSSENLQQVPGALEDTEAGRKRKEPDSDLQESDTKHTKLDGSRSLGGTFLSLSLNSSWHAQNENDDNSIIDDMDVME